MSEPQFYGSILIDAPVARVWQLISDERNVRLCKPAPLGVDVEVVYPDGQQDRGLGYRFLEKFSYEQKGVSHIVHIIERQFEYIAYQPDRLLGIKVSTENRTDTRLLGIPFGKFRASAGVIITTAEIKEAGTKTLLAMECKYIGSRSMIGWFVRTVLRFIGNRALQVELKQIKGIAESEQKLQ